MAAGAGWPKSKVCAGDAHTGEPSVSKHAASIRDLRKNMVVLQQDKVQPVENSKLLPLPTT
ncbi:hypothetical protein D3C87_2108960 [compost metagenome]